MDEDKAQRFSEPMGGELGLSRAFLRSCSEQNLPVGDTVYKNIESAVEGDGKKNKQIKKNMYR